MTDSSGRVENAAVLKNAVEELHQCRAVFKETVAVIERFRDEIAWSGSVSVFAFDRPDAKVCYAWSAPIEGGDRRRIYAVLGKPPIDSPEAAVRASIVSDFRGRD